MAAKFTRSINVVDSDEVVINKNVCGALKISNGAADCLLVAKVFGGLPKRGRAADLATTSEREFVTALQPAKALGRKFSVVFKASQRPQFLDGLEHELEQPRLVKAYLKMKKLKS